MEDYSLEKKTRVYWALSKARNEGSNITTDFAIKRLSKLRSNLSESRPLAQLATELLNDIVGVRKPKKETQVATKHELRGRGHSFMIIDDPSGGDAA